MQDSSTPSDKKVSSLKHAFGVGKNIVVVIDSAIVKRLGITEHETMFQEEVTDGGILLKLVRRED